MDASQNLALEKLEAELRSAEHGRVSVQERYDSALTVVATAEASYEATPSDAEWKKVMAARASRDRAELDLRRATRLEDTARAAYETAARSEVERRMKDAAQRASSSEWLEQQRDSLRRLQALDDEILRIRDQMLAVTEKQNTAVSDYHRCREALQTPQDPTIDPPAFTPEFTRIVASAAISLQRESRGVPTTENWLHATPFPDAGDPNYTRYRLAAQLLAEPNESNDE